MTFDPVMTSAFVFFVVGLVLYLWTTTRAGERHQRATLIVCWLLFALFASFLLFRFFPGDQATGTILGISVTGAVAVFFVVWKFGPDWTTKALKEDRIVETLKERVSQLEAEKGALQQAPGRREPVKLGAGRIPFKLISKKGRIITIATGNLSSVKNVDLWVNSENTYMQMARFFERNISGTIRYLGAKRDKGDFVVDDVVGKALAKEMEKTTMVNAGAVIETTAGELLASHGVKQVLHLAAVNAQYESGFRQVDNLGGCVEKVLERASKQPGCRSILFPLIGAGTGRGDLNATADAIVSAVVSWLESVGDDGLTDVYLLAATDVDCNAWKQALGKFSNVQTA